MITFIPPQFTEPVWKPIDLGDGASLEICVKKPTLADQLAALEETRGDTMTAFRLRSKIVDWRGVQDPDGKPVPYSWDSLSALCVAYPNAIWDLLRVVRAAHEVAEDAGEDPAKNSEPPPLAGGTATTNETTVSTAP